MDRQVYGELCTNLLHQRPLYVVANIFFWWPECITKNIYIFSYITCTCITWMLSKRWLVSFNS
jgi:hypothetical protein